jgi:hypothetical protein
MKCPYCIRVCCKCKRILVANTINFPKQKGKKYGISYRCRECEREYRREYGKREEVKEKRKEYRREYNQREEVKERRKISNQRYAEEHREERLKYWKEYNEKHKEERKEYYEVYWENNQDRLFNYNQKRRLLEEEQGNGLTDEQWFEMMTFFGWKCAYSDEYIGGKNNEKRSIDHIIPITKEGRNEVFNCVPMVKSYNASKSNKDMEDWYRQQEYFSEERLQKIYEWCEFAWNKWLKKKRRKGNKFLKNMYQN